MKNIIFCVLFLFVGCKGVDRLIGGPGEEHNDTAPLPNSYTITGTTIQDRQWVQPVRVVNSTVMVKIKRMEMADWYICNSYEVYTTTNGVGGGGIQFRTRTDGTGLNVAPTGTAYEITSILN